MTDNDIIVNADQTWFFTKDGPWSVFAKGTYQWDQFELWEQRFSPYGGFGYAVLREEDLKTNFVSVLVAPTSTGTAIAAGIPSCSSRSTPTGRSTRGRPSPVLSFAPGQDDFNNYLLTLRGLLLKLFDDSPLTFNIAVEHLRFRPGTGETGNDLKLVLGLGWFLNQPAFIPANGDFCRTL